MTRADPTQVNSSASSPASLPAIIAPKDVRDAAAMGRFCAAVQQHLQARQGARNPFERAATMRDLENLAGAAGMAMQLGNGAAVFMPAAPGAAGYVASQFDQFAEKLRNTRLFRELLKRTDDATRFDNLPDIVKGLLLGPLDEIAKQRGADIQRLERKIQDNTQSLSVSMEEVTAAFNANTAGVRQLTFASTTRDRAQAGHITSINARLDDFGGAGASVEETMTATADRVDGLEAQYTLKVNAGGAFAAIGLSATSSTAGVDDSYIIFVASNFAFVSDDDTIGTGPGQVDPTNPGAGRVPFGIDSDGVIYLNGEVRINAGGTSLSDLAAVTGIYVSYTSDTFKVDSAGAAVNADITLTANLTAGLTGLVTWSKTGAGTAPPAAGTTNTWTIHAADQTADTCTYTATLVSGSITYTDSVTIVRLRDGSNALTALLTNESHTVPADAAGTVLDWTGSSGSMKVYRGSTDISAAVAFAIAPGGNPSGLTATIGAATGAYSVTAAGTWPAGTSTATLTFRATVTTSGVATTIDKTFTLTKALKGANGTNGTDGTDGTNGVRGTVTGSGGMYGISATVWTAGLANRVVRNLVMGETGTTSLASTALNRIGDTVTLSNGTTFAETRSWSGTAWISYGVVIVGNVLVDGTLSGVEITGGGMVAGPNSEFQVNGSTGVVSMTKAILSVATFGNLDNPALPSITVTNYSTSTAEGILAQIPSGNTSSTAHAIRGKHRVTGETNYCSGLVGAANGKAFHAEAGIAGPFTGGHDVGIPYEVLIEAGSLVVDDGCLFRKDWSNTFFRVKVADQPRQKGVLGVYTRAIAPLDRYPLVASADVSVDDIGRVSGPPDFEAAKDDYYVGEVNALGEGQLLVCGLGGDIAAGDLLCASAMPGKAMAQGDDTLRAYTAAKAREAVVFSHPEEVKTIACIYLCG